MASDTDEFERLNQRIAQCERCPRLRAHCVKIAAEKKREFRDWEYWGRPVAGFGDPTASIWIVGLAPAAHGGNRTGRVFTGDSSGDWLYRALHRAGFANQATSRAIDDGLRLSGVYISAAARCAPPDNKPFPEEIENCAAFLNQEWRLLKDAWLFLALGSIGFNATLKLMERNGVAIGRPRPKFAHGAYYEFDGRAILASYHPSRQNTNTGVLTTAMWNKIFERAKKLVATKKSSRA